MHSRVMLVDETSERVEWIRTALDQAGFDVVDTLRGMDDLYQRVLDLEPDVVIIEAGSGKRDILEHLCQCNERYPKPVVMITEHSDSDTVKAAARAGISAYAVKGLSPDGVRSIINVAISQFDEYQKLNARLATAESNLADQKLLERAKGLLMERHTISENDAYQLLRKAAMDRSRRISDIARMLIKANGQSS